MIKWCYLSIATTIKLKSILRNLFIQIRKQMKTTIVYKVLIRKFLWLKQVIIGNLRKITNLYKVLLDLTTRTLTIQGIKNPNINLRVWNLELEESLITVKQLANAVTKHQSKEVCIQTKCKTITEWVLNPRMWCQIEIRYRAAYQALLQIKKCCLSSKIYSLVIIEVLLIYNKEKEVKQRKTLLMIIRGTLITNRVSKISRIKFIKAWKDVLLAKLYLSMKTTNRLLVLNKRMVHLTLFQVQQPYLTQHLSINNQTKE